MRQEYATAGMKIPNSPILWYFYTGWFQECGG